MEEKQVYMDMEAQLPKKITKQETALEEKEDAEDDIIKETTETI